MKMPLPKLPEPLEKEEKEIIMNKDKENLIIKPEDPEKHLEMKEEKDLLENKELKENPELKSPENNQPPYLLEI